MLHLELILIALTQSQVFYLYSVLVRDAGRQWVIPLIRWHTNLLYSVFPVSMKPPKSLKVTRICACLYMVVSLLEVETLKVKLACTTLRLSLDCCHCHCSWHKWSCRIELCGTLHLLASSLVVSFWVFLGYLVYQVWEVLETGRKSVTLERGSYRCHHDRM